MSATARSLVGGYFEHVIPGANVKVQLNPDVVDRLSGAAMEGFKAVPRRGLEIGGLLLGRVDNDCVVVEKIEALESEHQRGPSWLLSDIDKRLLTEAVSRLNEDASGMRVVGLYRSQTRTGFMPVEEDAALLAECCPGPGKVFLLIKPEAGGRSNALFAAGDGLRATSEPFAFRGRPAASIPARMDVHRAVRPDPPQPAADAPRFEQLPRLNTARVMEGMAADRAQPERARTMLTRAELGIGSESADHARGGLFSRIVWTVAILLCAGAGGYALARWWTSLPRAESAAAQSMGLHAAWGGTSLDLHWNRDSPLIRQANRGILGIEDGAHHRQLDLKPEDLTQGSIQYWPSSSDVRFKLEVFTRNRHGSESIRALSVPLSPVMAAHVSAMPIDTAAGLLPEALRPGEQPFATVDFEAIARKRQSVPPKPLHRVVPAGSADLRGRTKINTAVDVRVDIDAAGKVRRAEVVSKHLDRRREFETLALGASRGWTFTPAQNGSRHVSSQALLHYHFGTAAAPSAQ